MVLRRRVKMRKGKRDLKRQQSRSATAPPLNAQKSANELALARMRVMDSYLGFWTVGKWSTRLLER